MPYPDALKPRPLKQREDRFLILAQQICRLAAYSRLAYYSKCMIAVGYDLSPRLMAIHRHLFKPNNYTAGSGIYFRHKPDLAIPLFYIGLINADSIDPYDPWERAISKT